MEILFFQMEILFFRRQKTTIKIQILIKTLKILLLELINKTHKITTLNSISHLKILNLNKKFPYKNDDLNLYVKIFNIFSFL